MRDIDRCYFENTITSHFKNHIQDYHAIELGRGFFGDELRFSIDINSQKDFYTNLLKESSLNSSQIIIHHSPVELTFRLKEDPISLNNTVFINLSVGINRFEKTNGKRVNIVFPKGLILEKDEEIFLRTLKRVMSGGDSSFQGKINNLEITPTSSSDHIKTFSLVKDAFTYNTGITRMGISINHQGEIANTLNIPFSLINQPDLNSILAQQLDYFIESLISRYLICDHEVSACIIIAIESTFKYLYADEQSNGKEIVFYLEEN